MDPQETQRISASNQNKDDPQEIADGFEDDPWIGRTVDDFVIGSIIGKGGMGKVYSARQSSLGRSVALKFLTSDRDLRADAVIRFEAEARIAARLNHPNVVHIYALGSYKGFPYIVMELVQGRNLGQILLDQISQGNGPQAIDDCISIMKQSCQGLLAASELGLVHRDIKPENLMVTNKGLVKIADFGLARSLQTDAARMTQTGYTMGTPLYMSPEQVQGLDVDSRSDIYSLGMTFHHLLTGRPPLAADSPYALALKQIHERPPSVRLLRPDCPTGISDLVDWMTEKSQSLRPKSIEDVIQALNKYELGLALNIPKSNAGFAELPLFGKQSESSVPGAISVPLNSWNRRGLIVWLSLTAFGAFVASLIGRVQARRSEIALAATAKVWPPCLEMADWKRVPQKKSAAEQYRYALTQAPEKDLVAAWLAVPGNFPEDEDWAWRAYVQLTGDFVRRWDRFHLVWLLRGIDSIDHGAPFQNLSQVIKAAVDGLDGKETACLESLDSMVKETMDLNMAELILTILSRYRMRIGRGESVPIRLEKIQAQLMEILRIDPKMWPGNFSTGNSNR
jgi:eukaryotic-like serine/threonine-protein kinase